MPRYDVLLRRDLPKTPCDERQSPGVCFFGELFIRMTAPESMARDDVLRAVFDSQLEAGLNPVGRTGEIAATRAAHRPERGEMFDARREGVKESSEPIKLLLHWKERDFRSRTPIRLTNYQERRYVVAAPLLDIPTTRIAKQREIPKEISHITSR